MGKTGYKNCFWLQATCSGVILGKLECEIGIALQYENIFKFSLKRTFKRIRKTRKDGKEASPKKNRTGYETQTIELSKVLTPQTLGKNCRKKMPRRKKIIFLHLDGCSETPSTSRTNTYTQTKAKNIYFIHQATHIPIHK